MYRLDLDENIKDLCRRLGQNYLLIKPTRVKIGGKDYILDRINPSWITEEVFFNNSVDLSTKKTSEEENQRIWDVIKETFNN